MIPRGTVRGQRLDLSTGDYEEFMMFLQYKVQVVENSALYQAEYNFGRCIF